MHEAEGAQFSPDFWEGWRFAVKDWSIALPARKIER